MPRCKAKSTTTGEQCKKNAVAGCTVCLSHGAAAPQVREKARQRLLEMVDPALAVMERAIKRDAKERGKRIEWLQQRIGELHRIIDERAGDPAVANAPGGKTGHIVHRLKAVGSGPACTVVDEYEVDTGLLAELRKHEEQLRVELTELPAAVKDILDRAGMKETDKLELTGTVNLVEILNSRLAKVDAGK